jgi:hypothetical protein
MLARKYILPLVAWASRPCIFTLALVLCASALAADEPTVKIGPGGELIVGGFDPSSPDNAAAHAKALDEAIPRLVSLDVTSHEIYVRWNLCEPEEGKWDWSVYDKFFEIYKRHNIKCVPFLICGSAYSLPNWYYKKPGSQGYICLEHNQESDVQSLWNPKMREHVGSFIKAFCDHYRDTGRIESILLGITGNYGEAIYIATGDDWTADVHGKYHTHMGFWAGDEFAIKDFRDWLKKKYKSPEALSKAWGGAPRDFETVKPFLRKNAPNDRAWIDMVDWYVGSMTDYTRFWLAEVRKNFPARAGEIYVCTGGHAPPEHGRRFRRPMQSRRRVQSRRRITNEASDYRLNFSITRWVASASHQYGCYFSYEPAGGVDPRGVVARIYNATASGAKGLHYYHGNLFDSPAHTNAFLKSGSTSPSARLSPTSPSTTPAPTSSSTEALSSSRPSSPCATASISPISATRKSWTAA